MSADDPVQEFDYEIDILNVIFGAALGAYLGIVISNDGITATQLWDIVLLLGLMSFFLLNVKEIARSIHGKTYIGIRFPWNITFVLASGAVIQLLAYQIPLAGEKFSVIFRGWAFMLAIFLVAGLIRSRWKRD